jgi:uncharacterized protein (UPF0332 family)
VTDASAIQAQMAKAERALASASLLLDAGDDAAGACNRAYYAMFDAARAALSTTASDDEADAIRTHHGLIAAFGLRLVKPGLLPRALGRLLNRGEEARLLADYTGAAIERADAEELIVEASTFVDAIRRHLANNGRLR